MRTLLLVSAALAASACAGCGQDNRCGPSSGTVARVIDGDTIELASGETIRYIGIDTPESTRGADDCYGEESSDRNKELVEGRKVDITYDLECTDRFDRLLGYIAIDGNEINRQLVAEGFACTLFIPPNGAERQGEYQALETQAQQQGTGLWGACEDVTCD